MNHLCEDLCAELIFNIPYTPAGFKSLISFIMLNRNVKRITKPDSFWKQLYIKRGKTVLLGHTYRQSYLLLFFKPITDLTSIMRTVETVAVIMKKYMYDQSDKNMLLLKSLYINFTTEYLRERLVCVNNIFYAFPWMIGGHMGINSYRMSESICDKIGNIIGLNYDLYPPYGGMMLSLNFFYNSQPVKFAIISASDYNNISYIDQHKYYVSDENDCYDRVKMLEESSSWFE